MVHIEKIINFRLPVIQQVILPVKQATKIPVKRMTTIERIQKAKKSLKEDYSLEPFKQYIDSIGISNFKTVKDLGIKITPDENLENLCLIVRLKEEPSKDLKLYEIYHTFKVFYQKNVDCKLR